jgi:GTP-binding protein Era
MKEPGNGNGALLRCGFVALLGAPNAGKSTLLNSLVGAKVSIVTRKVQTTRSRLRGIAVEGDSQIVFVDTPGIFAPKRRLERAMVAAAWSGARDADVIALVFDANRKGIDPDSRLILDGLKDFGRRAILLLNKVDVVKRPRLLELAAKFEAEGLFDRIFMISALTGDGVGDLRAFLAAAMPEGPWHYPEDVSAAASGAALCAHRGDRALAGLRGRQREDRADDLCPTGHAKGHRSRKIRTINQRDTRRFSKGT